MKNADKVGLLLIGVCVAVVVSFIVVAGVALTDGESCPNTNAISEPRVIKIKEVIGTVVGGPQIVAGSPLIGYAVFVKEQNGMVALHATQCPSLANGQKVAMFQKGGPSNWYTFIRYE